MSQYHKMNLKRKKHPGKIFSRVLSSYPSLRDQQVEMVRRRLRKATMNARPVFGWGSMLIKIKAYRIIVADYVRDTGDLQVEDMPEEVLEGWFAHELGHVMDYQGRSAWQMVLFGLRYLYSDSFRRKAEYRADQYAIRHGFQEEIIAAKRFILEHDLLSQDYKDKISKYYMPVEEVRWHTENPQPLRNIIYEVTDSRVLRK